MFTSLRKSIDNYTKLNDPCHEWLLFCINVGIAAAIGTVITLLTRKPDGIFIALYASFLMAVSGFMPTEAEKIKATVIFTAAIIIGQFGASIFLNDKILILIWFFVLAMGCMSLTSINPLYRAGAIFTLVATCFILKFGGGWGDALNRSFTCLVAAFIVLAIHGLFPDLTKLSIRASLIRFMNELIALYEAHVLNDQKMFIQSPELLQNLLVLSNKAQSMTLDNQCSNPLNQAYAQKGGLLLLRIRRITQTLIYSVLPRLNIKKLPIEMQETEQLIHQNLKQLLKYLRHPQTTTISRINWPELPESNNPELKKYRYCLCCTRNELEETISVLSCFK